MNDYWKELSERFLKRECTVTERRLVRRALRDGLIDDDFRAAVESLMQSDEMTQFIDTQGDAPAEILPDLRRKIAEESNLGRGKSSNMFTKIPEWLKIAASVIIAVSATWAVMRYDDGLKPAASETKAVMQTVRVPAGQTVNMTLADGSKIWLNSSTEMKYPGQFDGNRREVWLRGEAYIEVAKNKDKPFVVHAGEYEVTALGTTLNVEAYRGDSAFAVTLFEGIVDVTKQGVQQTVRLQPATRINGNLQQPEKITNTDHYRWREGLLCFRDTYFNDIMKSFENCYGIRIAVENKRVSGYKCTVKFRRSEGVEYALKVLQKDVRFRYVRDEENQVIYIR